MIGSIFCEQLEGKIFFSTCVPTHQARQKCWLWIERLFPFSQSNPSAAFLHKKRIRLSSSLHPMHLPVAFIPFLHGEKRAVAQTSQDKVAAKFFLGRVYIPTFV